MNELRNNRKVLSVIEVHVKAATKARLDGNFRDAVSITSISRVEVLESLSVSLYMVIINRNTLSDLLA